MSKGLTKEFTKGIVKENPVLRLVLGTCPTLAVTTAAINGIGMGVAATLVLLGSNIVISLLRNVIPDKVRIPAFITIIAAFVTIIQMFIKAYVPSIDAALGIYLPLIVVNCIILARAEMFASKNPVLPSILDALGMGVGFTCALVLMGAIRELLGAGTIFGIAVTKGHIEPMLVMILAPGGFFVFGVLVALANKIAVRMGREPVNALGCSGCPNEGACPGCGPDADPMTEAAKEGKATASDAAQQDIRRSKETGRDTPSHPAVTKDPAYTKKAAVHQDLHAPAPENTMSDTAPAPTPARDADDGVQDASASASDIPASANQANTGESEPTQASPANGTTASAPPESTPDAADTSDVKEADQIPGEVSGKGGDKG